MVGIVTLTTFECLMAALISGIFQGLYYLLLFIVFIGREEFVGASSWVFLQYYL